MSRRVSPETVSSGFGCFDFPRVPSQPTALYGIVRQARPQREIVISAGDSGKTQGTALDEVLEPGLVFEAGTDQGDEIPDDGSFLDLLFIIFYIISKYFM